MLIQPRALFKPTTTLASSTIDTVRKIDKPETKGSKSETISSIFESHESETKSEQKFHMKLEHKTPPIAESKTRTEQTITTKEIGRDLRDIAEPLIKLEEKSMSENENIETSTIAKKDALSYFESITKESDVTTPKRPKGMIKLTEDGQVQEAKVGELMKSYERAATSYDVKKPEPRPSDFQATKKTVQDIFTKLEQGSSPRGVENKLFEFPYETPKLPPMEIKKATFEDATVASDSSMSQLRVQTESTETMMKSFNLMPEPPPEICYMPKPEESKKKRPEVFVKAKQLQESFDKTLSPVEAPIGGVKIFPTPRAPEPVKVTTTTPAFTIPPPFELEKKEAFEETCTMKKDTYEKRESKSFKEEKMEPWKYASTSVLSTSPIRPWSSSSDVETKSHVSTDLSEYRCHSAASSHQEAMVRSTSPKPSADALAMEKSWAKKCADSNRKSWPPQAETAQKREWNIPVDEYKSTTRESKQEIEERPQGGIKKTSTESSASVEKRSWSSKEQITEKISEGPVSKLGPIIYNAETIKVDHTVNTTEEKSFFEKRVSESNLEKAETTRKSEELKRWTHDEDLKAPGLVKKIEPTTVKPLTTSHYFTESVVLEPGSPPEIGYIPPPVVKEQVVSEHIVKAKREEPPVLPPKDVRITPPPVPSKKPVKISTPTPTKFIKGSLIHESDYESDFDGQLKAKWRPYESDNEEPHYRRVKAPVPKQPTRPRSTEPEPLPPSKFETPLSQFAGPPRPLVVADSAEKTTKKTMFKRYERESKQQQQPQQPIPLRPGSPPIYMQPSALKSPAPKSPPTKKPESPKFKTKVFQQESGYMADTDEPFQQKVSTTMTQKSFGKRDGSSMTTYTESRTSSSESRTKFFESYKSDVRKEESSVVPPPICSAPATPKVAQQQRSSFERSCASSSSTGLHRFESVKVRSLLRVSLRVLLFFPFSSSRLPTKFINLCGINRASTDKTIGRHYRRL